MRMIQDCYPVMLLMLKPPLMCKYPLTTFLSHRSYQLHVKKHPRRTQLYCLWFLQLNSVNLPDKVACPWFLLPYFVKILIAHLMKKIGFNPSITYPVEIPSTPPMSDSTFVWCAFPVNIQTTLIYNTSITFLWHIFNFLSVSFYFASIFLYSFPLINMYVF